MNLSPQCVEFQNRFWRLSSKDRQGENPGPDGELRFAWFNQFFANAASLKRHQNTPTKRNKWQVCKRWPRLRWFKGTEVDRRVQHVKRHALLEHISKVQLEGTELKYELSFELLSHMFQGDGACDVDVD